MKKRYLLLSLIVSVSLFISCSKSSSETGGSTINCGTTATTFSMDVNPLIQTFCNQPSCHNNGSSNGPGPLTNHAQVFNAKSNIRGAVLSGLMPKNTTLSTAQKNAIICWIDSGALNN
ncbi:MAG: hypothetical protein ACXWV6_11475 [Chitinophagaceae bacterium]